MIQPEFVEESRLKVEGLYLTLEFPGPTWSLGAQSETPCAPPDSWAPVRRAGSRAAGRRTRAARRGLEERTWRPSGGWPGVKRTATFRQHVQSFRTKPCLRWRGEGAAPVSARISIFPRFPEDIWGVNPTLRQEGARFGLVLLFRC